MDKTSDWTLSKGWRLAVLISALYIVLGYLAVMHFFDTCGQVAPKTAQVVSSASFHTQQAAATDTSSNIKAGSIADAIDVLEGSVYLAKSKTNPPFLMSLGPKDYDGPRWRIFMSGLYYEAGLTAVTEKVCESDIDGVMIDLGANAAWVSLLCASKGRVAYAVEGIPFLYQKIQESVAVNGFGDRFHVFNNIVSDKSGDFMNFQIHPRNPGASKVVSNKTETSIAVESVTVDELLSSEKRDVVFAKIDVEGHECHVLRGMDSMLKRGRIKYLHIELLSTCPDVFVALMEYGYEFILNLEFPTLKKDMKSRNFFGSDQEWVDYIFTVRNELKEGRPGRNPNFVLKHKSVKNIFSG